MHDNEWHERRRQGIGGSDAAVIMCLSPWKTVRELAEEKLGIRGPDDEPTPLMEKGTVLEAVARRKWLAETGRVLLPGPRNRNHPENKWLRCEVDGITVSNDGDKAVLEIKCPTAWTVRKVRADGLFPSWLCQVQHNMLVTGLPRADLVLLDADRWEIMAFSIDADPEFQQTLFEAERTFWTMIANGELPPIQETDAAPVRLPKADPGELTRRDDPEWGEAAAELAELKRLKDEAAELYERQAEKVKALMGDAPVVEGGGVRVYWRETVRRSLDTRGLRKAVPDIAEKFTKETRVRSFRVYMLED